MITVRGRFRQKNGDYILWGGPLVMNDPCNGASVMLYIGPKGNYFYYDEEFGYVLTSGQEFFYDPFLDNWSGEWIWNYIYVSGSDLFYNGSYQSPCGPY